MKYDRKLDVVTGAFGFTGRYITELLLEKGVAVRTITNHPNRPNPFGSSVEVYPYNFDNPSLMVEALRGVDTVYNTYWVRYNYGRTTFGQGVANAQNLMRAAKEAGVRRFVHLSITNPDEHSSSGYLRGKALMEKTLINSGMSYAIARPTVLFGEMDILINNIAWLLRRLPAFAIPGSGEYRIQPVFARDVAKLAVELGPRSDNVICDAVGPETYTFTELVYAIRDAVRSRSIIFKAPPSVAYWLTMFINPLVGDVIIHRTEVDKIGLDVLSSYAPSLCKTRFSSWLRENAEKVGRTYASEIKRHFIN